jgi:alkaline phosphatase D
MPRITRRDFAKLAVSIGASIAWGQTAGKLSRIPWQERRAAYPEGVASADPDSDSVLLWTLPVHRGSHADR